MLKPKGPLLRLEYAPDTCDKCFKREPHASGMTGRFAAAVRNDGDARSHSVTVRLTDVTPRIDGTIATALPVWGGEPLDAPADAEHADCPHVKFADVKSLGQARTMWIGQRGAGAAEEVRLRLSLQWDQSSRAYVFTIDSRNPNDIKGQLSPIAPAA